MTGFGRWCSAISMNQISPGSIPLFRRWILNDRGNSRCPCGAVPDCFMDLQLQTDRETIIDDLKTNMQGAIMDSIEIFNKALTYEQKIRDLYQRAQNVVDDERGGSIFKALADDEQSHVDFLLYGLEKLRGNEAIEVGRLQTSIPELAKLDANIETMMGEIPERMLGDIKIVLNSALKLEKETSDFYRDAMGKTEGAVREIMEKFLEIEENHTAVVQTELDHAMKNGMWFDFMEINLEAE